MIETLWLPASDGSSDAAELPHILLVVDQFPKALGGGERIVLRLAEALPRYGYRVSILTFAVHPESALFAAPRSCPLYVLPLTKTYDWTALRAAFELGRFLREHKIAVVQTFFESSDLWAGLVAKVLSRAKLIWSRRDMGILRDRKHSIAYRLMSRAPDRVFAVSERVRRHAIEVDGIDPALVHTIYNGLDLSVFTAGGGPVRVASSEFLITTIGNIRRVKGHDLLLRAAAIVLQDFPDTRFTIAGEILDPEYFAELQRLIEVEDLSDKVHFLGGITDLRGHLLSADALVLPSRSEGFSNVIIEAMAASLPVVATDVGGNAEAVADGINGWVVPPEDAAGLARALSKLLADPVRAKTMGGEGRRIAAERFTSEAMMRRTTEEYRKLLRG